MEIRSSDETAQRDHRKEESGQEHVHSGRRDRQQRVRPEHSRGNSRQRVGEHRPPTDLVPPGNHPSDVAEQGGNRHNRYSDPWPVQRDEDGQHDERRAGADDTAEHSGT